MTRRKTRELARAAQDTLEAVVGREATQRMLNGSLPHEACSSHDEVEMARGILIKQEQIDLAPVRINKPK